MKIKRLISAAIALLLVASLPVTAFAADWYLEDGSITVSADNSGQTVTQGSAAVEDAAPVIKQRDSSTATTNTVTITAAENQTANVTLSGVNISFGDYDTTRDNAAVSTKGEGSVTVELDGKNTVKSGYNRAGVEKNNTGSLTITDANNDNGSLRATGGISGAGIGGGDQRSGSNITISGGEVNAQGGQYGAGIGGGRRGSGSNITITGGEVNAQGGEQGAGIGGGWDRQGSDITISGNAQVTAQGGVTAAGIGGGFVGRGSNITISGDAQLKVQGGKEAVLFGYIRGAGAPIGNGGGDNGRDGAEVAPDVSKLTAKGKIEYYEPDANMEKDAPIEDKTIIGKYVPEPEPESKPLYRVKDADGRDLSYKTERKDGVLTVTVDADFAILTGKLVGIGVLKAQGVEKIVFITKNDKSTFALADLLGKDSWDGEYKLTHGGKTVTFTLGAKNIDVSGILEKA